MEIRGTTNMHTTEGIWYPPSPSVGFRLLTHSVAVDWWMASDLCGLVLAREVKLFSLLLATVFQKWLSFPLQAVFYIPPAWNPANKHVLHDITCTHAHAHAHKWLEHRPWALRVSLRVPVPTLWTLWMFIFKNSYLLPKSTFYSNSNPSWGERGEHIEAHHLLFFEKQKACRFPPKLLCFGLPVFSLDFKLRTTAASVCTSQNDDITIIALSKMI